MGGASVGESSSAATTSSEGASSRSLSQPEARMDSEDFVHRDEKEEEPEAVGGASGGGASNGTSNSRNGSVDGFAKPKAPLSKQ